MARPGSDDPLLAFPTQAAWEAWLAEHHDALAGVWLKLARRDSGMASVTYPEAVECALCYGWIDGQKAGHDDAHWLQRFTPRRPNSRWSRINRDKAEELIAAGRMQPAGLREVRRAQADGRWDAAYASPSAATVPDDLRDALDRDDAARAAFVALDGRNRYAILHRIEEAKRPETRARRIATLVAMLARGETLYPRTRRAPRRGGRPPA